MNYKYWLLLVGLVGLIMLSGCSAEAEDNGGSEESNLIPEGVENGSVSQEFYNEIIRFYEEGQEYEDEQNIYIIEVDPDYGKNKDIPFRKELNSHVEEYVDFLDTFEFIGENDIEEELANSLSNYVVKKRDETEFVNVTASIGTATPETYGLLLMKQEETEKLKSELYSLLDEHKLGYKN